MSVRAFSWRVFATERATGAQIEIFRLAAKTEGEALTKAQAQLSRGTGYFPAWAAEDWVADPWSCDFWVPTMMA